MKQIPENDLFQAFHGFQRLEWAVKFALETDETAKLLTFPRVPLRLIHSLLGPVKSFTNIYLFHLFH